MEKIAVLLSLDFFQKTYDVQKLQTQKSITVSKGTSRIGVLYSVKQFYVYNSDADQCTAVGLKRDTRNGTTIGWVQHSEKSSCITSCVPAP
jgi:hypothetical protein